MEQIKDLNLLISEAKRMANAFRAFERIPRVLEIIQSSSGFVEDLEKTAEKKKKEIADLQTAIEKRVEALGMVEDRVKEKGEDLDSLNNTMDKRKAGLIEAMEIELDEIRKKSEAKLATVIRNREVQIKANEKAANDSEVDMIEAINFHKAQISKFEDITQDAEKRAEEAVTDLDRIKKSLFGGN